jgi:hypothetical protein
MSLPRQTLTEFGYTLKRGELHLAERPRLEKARLPGERASLPMLRSR